MNHRNPSPFAWENVLNSSKAQLIVNQILLEDQSLLLPRQQTIRWMLHVTAKANLSAGTSDSAIQMMDRYYAHRIFSGMTSSTTESFETDCGMASAACLMLSSKLHEIRPLAATSFPYDELQLIQCERHLLCIFGFDIVPQISPTMLVRQLFSLWWEPLPVNMTSHNIIMLTDALIGQFWKESSSDSLRFAPSTIAISALLLAFSKAKMNCSVWLQRLPDGMLPSSATTSSTFPSLVVNHEMSLLDINACLLAMTKEERTSCSSHHPTQPDSTYYMPLTSPEEETMANMTTLPLNKRRRANTPTTIITSPSKEMFPES